MTAAGNERSQNMGPRLCGPAMKQLNFNWEADDKYNKHKNFMLKVNNISKSYNTPQAEQLTIIKNWLVRKGLQFTESLMQTEGERCNTMEGLVTTFKNKCKLHFNETIKSLQFNKLPRQAKESTEEWVGRLRLAVVECNYREEDRQLKEQFIHRLNDNDMVKEIIRELTKAEESVDITSEQVLGWAKRVEAQRGTVCNYGQFN